MPPEDAGVAVDAATVEVDSGVKVSGPRGDAAATASTDAGSSQASSGSSDWWEPDILGTWPDASASLDASASATNNGNSDSKGAPNLPQPNCSIAAPGHAGQRHGISLFAFGLSALLVILNRIGRWRVGRSKLRDDEFTSV